MIAMGLLAMIMFCCRFFFFKLYESPKYLMGRGRDEEAVRVVHEVARINGKTSNLTLADLEKFNQTGQQGVDASAALKRKLEKVNFTHIRALFASPKLAWSTSLIILIWAFIGLGFPLYNAFLPCKHPFGAICSLSLARLMYHNIVWEQYIKTAASRSQSCHATQILSEVGTLILKSSRYPSNARSEVRRWFHIHNLPQLDHHRRSWCTRRSDRRCTGSDSSIRSKRCLGPVDRADRRIPVLLYYRPHLQRVVGLELCLQLHE